MIELYSYYNGSMFSKGWEDLIVTFDTIEQLIKYLKRVYKIRIETLNYNDSIEYNDTIDYLNDFDNEGQSYMQDIILIDDIEEDNLCLYY